MPYRNPSPHRWLSKELEVVFFQSLYQNPSLHRWLSKELEVVFFQFLYRNPSTLRFAPSQQTTMPWMYILQCKDGSYYVGSTIDLDQRLDEHNRGLAAKYTARRLPVKMVYAEEFSTIAEAYTREKQVQGWSRAKREALIRGDFNQLPALSKKKFKKPPT
jgi:putative endonuclease